MDISLDYKFILIKNPTKKGTIIETHFSQFAGMCYFFLALLIDKEDRFGPNYSACFNPLGESLKSMRPAFRSLFSYARY